MSNYKINDAGDLRKYFAQIPHLIDDSDLSVYAYRLYGHLKRVAGDDGKCWQSVTTLSEACKMSRGMVGKARDELERNKLITVEEIDNPRGGRDFKQITIVDIWAMNMQKYSSSPGGLASPPHELTSSPGGLKNNPIKNNPIKNIEEGGGRPNIVTEYESLFSKTVDHATFDKMMIAAEIHGEQHVIEAMQEAVKNNVRNWPYASAILDRWKVEGYGTSKGNGRKSKPVSVLDKMLEELEDGE